MEAKNLPIERVIWRILNDNRMGIKLTSQSLVDLMSSRLGKKVWPYYITRWRRGKIGVSYKKVLLQIYGELCDPVKG